MRLFSLAALLAVALQLVFGVAGATAQEGTAVAFPLTPDPAECQVAPRQQDEVLTLLTGTPVAAASPATSRLSAVPSEADLPAGSPADAATVAGIVTTARELIACNNAGEFTRVLAFFTDDFIREAFGGDPALAAQVAASFATPAATLPAAAHTELLDVRGVRVLDDGRVGAVIEDRDPQQTVVFFMIFVHVGDRWLIDGQISVQAAATPTAGTPPA
ncbi:MAG: hypothetical protein M3N47_01995 [Chloroflexota bacterium]|nr:hypothetical protein [Chloroflexota bacterium]